MKAFLIACSVAFGIALMPANASAAARNYDCTKAANANKAACKTAAKAAPKTAKATAPASAHATKSVAAASKGSTKTVTQTKVERTYDCSKAGNKDKAACKSATPSKPVVTQTSVATTTRHYDCSKAGNATKQQCKATTTKQPTKTVTKAAPKAAPPQASSEVVNRDPKGAIAMCKDGTYSHAKARTGACSRHGGVGKWLR